MTDKATYFVGQGILPQDFNDNNTLVLREFETRFVKTMGYGIIDGATVSLSPSNANAVDVAPGQAVFILGTRSQIHNDPTVPDPSRSNITEAPRLSIPIPATDGTYYVLLKSKTIQTDLRTPDPLSGLTTPQPTREYESYEIVVRSDSSVEYPVGAEGMSWWGTSPGFGPAEVNSGELDLATVTVSSNQISSILDTRKWVSSLFDNKIIHTNSDSGTVNLMDVVNSTISAISSIQSTINTSNLVTYFDDSHVNGIIGNPASTMTILNLQAIRDGLASSVDIQNLLPGEAVYISGRRFTTLNGVTTQVSIQFTSGDSPGNYDIVVDANGNVVKQASTTLFPHSLTSDIIPLITVVWDSTSLFLVKEYRSTQFTLHHDIENEIHNINTNDVTQLRIEPTPTPSKSVILRRGIYYISNVPKDLTSDHTIDLSGVVAGLSDQQKKRVTIMLDTALDPDPITNPPDPLALGGGIVFEGSVPVTPANNRIKVFSGPAAPLTTFTLGLIPAVANNRFIVIGSVIVRGESTNSPFVIDTLADSVESNPGTIEDMRSPGANVNFADISEVTIDVVGSQDPSVFTTSFTISDDTGVIVYSSGVFMKRGSSEDYQITPPNRITFTSPRKYGEKVTIRRISL